MEKTYMTLQVRPHTHKRMLLFRIRAKAKNMDEAVKLLLRFMREQKK